VRGIAVTSGRTIEVNLFPIVSSNVRDRFALVASLSLVTCLTYSGPALASPGPLPPTIVPSGGVYEGPGDIVPPVDDEHDIGRCDMPLGLVCTAQDSCDVMDWQPQPLRCTLPALTSSNPEPVWARLYTLSIREIVEGLQSGDMCLDEYGNITTCLEAPFPISEVHIFESGWINGYDSQAAIESAVPVTVCVGGEVLSVGWPFEELVKAEACEITTVCLSFSAECMREALLDWALSGLSPFEWSNKWLLAVDFVSCDPCETDPIEPIGPVGPRPVD
jgi:hypothetical protein